MIELIEDFEAQEGIQEEQTGNEASMVRIIVFGDTKGKEDGVNKKVVSKIMHAVQHLKPQPHFMVILGDMTAGGREVEELQTNLKQFKMLLSRYQLAEKVLPVIGNHETIENGDIGLQEAVFESVFSEFKPHHEMEGSHKTVYYVDIGDTRLIVLNTFHLGDIHQINPEQLRWFDQVSNVSMKNKLLFMHSPAFPTGAHMRSCLDRNPVYRDQLWEIVDRNGIDLVFAGHEHNYSRRFIDSRFSAEGKKYQRKVMQIISGGGGEKLKDKYRSKKGVVVSPKDAHHYMIIDIKENSIKGQAISIKGKKLDEFVINK